MRSVLIGAMGTLALLSACHRQGGNGVDLGAELDLSSDDAADGGLPDGFIACGANPCPTPFVCKYGFCVPSLGTCTTSGDCPGDSYCDSDGTCVPYGVPPDKINDPTCTRSTPPPNITPT